MALFKNYCFLGKILCFQLYKNFMLNLSFFWQKFQNKNIVEQRRTMEGKTDSMTAKKNIIKGVIFCYPCKWKFEQRRFVSPVGNHKFYSRS